MGEEIHEKKERNHKKRVSLVPLSLSLLGKHTYKIAEYKLGLKHLLLGHWVGSNRFSRCGKLPTHQKQVNWELDSKIHPVLWARHQCPTLDYTFYLYLVI